MNKSTAQASSSTKDQLIEAALEALKTVGFAGATSRAIARIGGFNQALIFYHYGSLDALLLAALDRTSEQRLERYRAALAGVESLEQLAELAARIYREDRESGHLTVVSQMVAGSLARPELAPEIAKRMGPWLELAEEALAKVSTGTVLETALPLPDLAYAAVTYYLGVNLLANLDPERSRAEFERAVELAGLAGTLLRA
jgi:AcrR family transcriptional regulator